MTKEPRTTKRNAVQQPASPAVSEEAHAQRIRTRAYHLWEADGRPHGNDVEYWERARALVGIEENPEAGRLPNPVPPGADAPLAPPPVEEAAIQENLGEIPGRLTDQGDRPQTPAPRRRRTAAKPS